MPTKLVFRETSPASSRELLSTVLWGSRRAALDSDRFSLQFCLSLCAWGALNSPLSCCTMLAIVWMFLFGEALRCYCWQQCFVCGWVEASKRPSLAEFTHSYFCVCWGEQNLTLQPLCTCIPCLQPENGAQMRLTQLPELLKPPLTWLGFGCPTGVFTVLLRQPKTGLWLPALLFPSASPWVWTGPFPSSRLCPCPSGAGSVPLLAWGSSCAGSALRASGFLREKQEFETDRKGRGSAYVPLIALRCSGAGYSGFGC